MQLGPASIELDGPVIRPLLRAGSATPGGWNAELGLALDALGATDDGHRELFAQWREAEHDVTLVATARSSASTNEDTTPEGVAVAAISAVLDLVGGWVLGVDDVKAQLAKSVGSTTVGAILTGPVLDPAAPVNAPRLVPDALEGWPAKLLTLAVNLAGAQPSVAIGPFQLGVTNTLGRARHRARHHQRGRHRPERRRRLLVASRGRRVMDRATERAATRAGHRRRPPPRERTVGHARARRPAERRRYPAR